MPVSRKDGRNLADIERGALSPTHGGGSAADRETRAGSTRPEWQKILHRVPPQVRENKKHIFDPAIVSLGPYHHGQPQCRRLEEQKNEVRNIVLKSNDDEDKQLVFCVWIVERMDEIRRFYGGLSEDEYEDGPLAEMMLRDACFVVFLMKFIITKDQEIDSHAIRHLGGYDMADVSVDVFKLENQIPWWVFTLLIGLIYDNGNKDEGEALICKFLGMSVLEDVKRLPWEEGTEKEPLHLLEAFRSIKINEAIKPDIDLVQAYRNIIKIKGAIIEDDESTNNSSRPTLGLKWWRKKGPEISVNKLLQSPFRSVTELKAKGIYFRPSSHSLNDVRFNSYSTYGTLHIPSVVVKGGAAVVISNIIALEMSPGYFNNEPVMTSYVCFMKSLLEKPNDAKELQEKGILISNLNDSDQIIRMFKEIDTHGSDFSGVYEVVKMRIDQHCSSKAKTWIAELINTYFRNPWTAIALFAATLLLCLTFLQTYFTINPRKGG